MAVRDQPYAARKLVVTSPSVGAATTSAVTVGLVQGKDFLHRRGQTPELGLVGQRIQRCQAFDHRVSEDGTKNVCHG